jgi:hypothetical protein
MRPPLAGLATVACLVMGGRASAQPTVTAFVRFNVVPMTSDTVLRDQTILVSDGKIVAIGPWNRIAVPRTAVRADGRGQQFIVPALADMHTHTTDPRELALFASHGVLTILNMGWSPESFVAVERLRYNSGELFGPTVFESRRMNRPYGKTSGVATVAQGRDTVQYAKRLGYDFIKVYSFLDDTVYQAIMQEARTQGIPVIGHQTFGIGLRRGFELGLRMVAHAEELRPKFGVPVSSERADSLVQLFEEFGAWLTPTLSTFEAISKTWGNPARLEQYVSEGSAAHVPEATIEAWRRTNYHTQNGSVVAHLASYEEATRKLIRAGVPMLAGTDGPSVPGMISGVAIHDEMAVLRSLGMTTFQALATATSNPGRFVTTFVPAAAPFGIVSVGARADLLIVAANPLEDLTTLRTPLSVVRLGRVYSARQLDSIRVARPNRRLEEQRRRHVLEPRRFQPRFQVVGQRGPGLLVETIEPAKQPLLDRLRRLREQCLAGPRQAQLRAAAILLARLARDDAALHEPRDHFRDRALRRARAQREIAQRLSGRGRQLAKDEQLRGGEGELALGRARRHPQRVHDASQAVHRARGIRRWLGRRCRWREASPGAGSVGGHQNRSPWASRAWLPNGRMRDHIV